MGRMIGIGMEMFRRPLRYASEDTIHHAFSISLKSTTTILMSMNNVLQNTIERNKCAHRWYDISEFHVITKNRRTAQLVLPHERSYPKGRSYGGRPRVSLESSRQFEKSYKCQPVRAMSSYRWYDVLDIQGAEMCTPFSGRRSI